MSRRRCGTDDSGPAGGLAREFTVSIGNRIATLLSCCTTPVEDRKSSPGEQVPNGTIIGIDGRLQAIAAKSGAMRSSKQARADLGAQMRRFKNGLPGDWALTAVALPTQAGGRVLSLDMSKGELPDSDPVLLLHLADTMLNDRVASLVEPVEQEPDPLQPPAGRTAIERLLAGPLRAQITTEQARYTISSRPRQERPGSTFGVIDVAVESDRGESWRTTASLHALPLRRPSLMAHRVKEAMALGARYGGALADKSITPGVALIHEGRHQNLAPALAAIGLLRGGASIEQTVEGIRAAKHAARHRVAPRHAGPLPPPPPVPLAERPVARSIAGPAARSGPDGVRLAPSPVIRCPAERLRASSVKKDSGMRLEPSPVIRMPIQTPTLPPEGHDESNQRAFDAVNRDLGVKQAMQDLAARMARPSGLAGWYRRVFHGEKPEPMDRLAGKLVDAVDEVITPRRGTALGAPGEALPWLRNEAVRQVLAQGFSELPAPEQERWRARIERPRVGGWAAARRRQQGGRGAAPRLAGLRDTSAIAEALWLLKTVAARAPAGSGMAPDRQQD